MPRSQRSVRLPIRKFMFWALLVVAVSVMSPPASADWVGSIVTERPAGQSSANGLANEFGDVTFLVNDTLFFRGAGSATVTLALADQTIIVERSCHGSLFLHIQYLGDERGHLVELIGPSGSGVEICGFRETSLEAGVTVHVEMQGGFSCSGTSGCDGSQNGKLVFRLTVE